MREGTTMRIQAPPNPPASTPNTDPFEDLHRTREMCPCLLSVTVFFVCTPPQNPSTRARPHSKVLGHNQLSYFASRLIRKTIVPATTVNLRMLKICEPRSDTFSTITRVGLTIISHLSIFSTFFAGGVEGGDWDESWGSFE